MIRLSFLLFLFISYGNFSPAINNLILFSLINIAFFSILKHKRLNFYDYLLFILTTLIIEIFLDIPLFISTVILIIPIILISYLINNVSIPKFFNALVIFVLSLTTLAILNHEIYIDFIFYDYLLLLLILILIFLGLNRYGKE